MKPFFQLVKSAPNWRIPHMLYGLHKAKVQTRTEVWNWTFKNYIMSFRSIYLFCGFHWSTSCSGRLNVSCFSALKKHIRMTQAPLSCSSNGFGIITEGMAICPRNPREHFLMDVLAHWPEYSTWTGVVWCPELVLHSDNVH